MHMADALLSPAVGGTMWAVSLGAVAYCSAKVQKESDDRKVPLMGVIGAFVFAAQMINFTIPATGSSGHLGGGLLLAILLGPHAAFLTIASVLVVQSLFFADGGLLALGCNIFNLGFFPAFIAYPFIFRKIAGEHAGRMRMNAAAVVAAVAGLQLGSLGVVLETVFSGVSELPFSTFALLMQPIHLAIGVVEGLVTASVVMFVHKARPEILADSLKTKTVVGRPLRNVLIAFSMAALFTGGVVSWFASQNPDGLEWAVSRASGKEELQAPAFGLHSRLAAIQDRIAFLPDYSLKKSVASLQEAATDGKAARSLAGVVGGAFTLFLIICVGFLLKRRSLA